MGGAVGPSVFFGGVWISRGSQARPEAGAWMLAGRMPALPGGWDQGRRRLAGPTSRLRKIGYGGQAEGGPYN
jgi:hypothetical protein